MTGPQVLVAGIGNIFLGDDAFGVEVAQRLARRPLPGQVRVVDFGIRGLDLTYALLDGYETVILVDAVPRGGRPGTLYVIEPEPGEIESSETPGLAIDAHGLDPVKILRLARALGGPVRRVLLVGCEPDPSAPEAEMSMEMSEPVRQAVDEAVRLVESLVADILGRENATA
jgi:hydrogenase maturation protease